MKFLNGYWMSKEGIFSAYPSKAYRIKLWDVYAYLHHVTPLITEEILWVVLPTIELSSPATNIIP
jgi:hypothetical protein